MLDAILQLLHPFIPFITEEIAAKLNPERSTIMRGPFPEFDESRIDPEAERKMEVIMGVISSVRNIRAEMNIPPSRILPAAAMPTTQEERDLVESSLPLIRALARVGDLAIGEPGANTEPPRMSATAVVGEMRVFVPLEGIVDPDAEIARLNKELGKIEKELDAVSKKLSNSDFLSKPSRTQFKNKKNGRRNYPRNEQPRQRPRKDAGPQGRIKRQNFWGGPS